jgi:hypothetical protein
LLGVWLIPRFGDHLLLADSADGSLSWLSLEEREGQRADAAEARAETLQIELDRLRAKQP